MRDKALANKITSLLNNGFAFGRFFSQKERRELTDDILHYYDKNFFGAFVEEEMLYVVDSQRDKIMMMEITRNSIYFNPYEHTMLLELIVLTLEFFTDRFGMKEYSTEKLKSNKEVDEEEESTEDEEKPKPNFDII